MSKRKERTARIDYIKSTVTPFKGTFLRDNPSASTVLVSFASLVYAARYAYFVRDTCPAAVIVPENSKAIHFTSRVNVAFTIE